MKTLKFSTLLVALASVFTFSSCMDNDNNDYGNRFYSYVTITGDSSFGYTFHSDYGCTLKPTSYSIQTVLPGLATSAVKRAMVAFELVGDETTTELHAGQTYDIDLVSDAYSNYAIPTYYTINTDDKPAALDSLMNKNNGHITSVNGNIWAANGYANAEMVLKYSPNANFYLNTYYNAEDVDAANNCLTLNIYYNSNTTNSYTQGQGVFSFDLPEEVYNTFQKDTIELVLKAKVGESASGMDIINDAEMSEIGRCKLPKSALFPPVAY